MHWGSMCSNPFAAVPRLQIIYIHMPNLFIEITFLVMFQLTIGALVKAQIEPCLCCRFYSWWIRFYWNREKWGCN